jgi:hypothetical protein
LELTVVPLAVSEDQQHRSRLPQSHLARRAQRQQPMVVMADLAQE